MFDSFKGFTIATAVVASMILFGLLYIIASGTYDRTVRDNAREVSGIIAEQTFAGMFQVMRRGWTRVELEQFLEATRQTFRDTPYEVDIYRGPVVEKLFGPIEQKPLDTALLRSLESGAPEVIEDGYAGKIFLNLSPRVMVLGDFLQDTRRIIERYGIAPGRIVFEITERDTIRNLSLLEKFVGDLKMEGYQFAIDDFGSGFSSFHYIKRFPIDFVKIEGEFVVNMLNDSRDMSLVRGMAMLARELGIKTIAEYVENEEVLECVRSAQIDYVQGYHVGRPGPDFADSPGRV